MPKANLFLVLLLAAAAASTAALAQPPTGQQVVVFISPMGEPFRRSQGPGEPIERWFTGADTDRDGAIGVVEFQADAARFFATLDVNHDGEIAPDEVIRYETEVAPEVQSGIRAVSTDGHGQMRLRRGEGPFGMGSQALLAIPEPVVSADADFNRGISLPEFRHTAGQRFLLIDRNHDGRITRDELSPPPPEERRRR